VLALAAAALVLCVAAALAARVTGFETWLRGSPGKPAPEAEQRAFETENRSWTSFPRGTQLRELLRTKAGGREYVLYGFRSGDTACVQLKALAFDETSRQCIPLSTLAHSNSPLVVADHDLQLGVVGPFASAEASFGIAADGVDRVDVEAVDGVHRAVLGGNAYLVVDSEPSTGNRFLSYTAFADGKRTTIARPSNTFIFGSARPPRGPSRVEARIPHPRIGWYERGEKRGVSLDDVTLTAEQRKQFYDASTMGGLRLVKPDPASGLVVGIAGNLCVVSGEGGKACATRDEFFARGPVYWSLMGGSGGAVLLGAAADGVARVRIFQGDGLVLTPPLRNNLFATRLGVEPFALRIVSYDRRGRIVGVETFPPRPFHFGATRAARRLPRMATVRGPRGAVATVFRGPIATHPRYPDAYRCWRVTFSDGPSRGNCEQVRRTSLVSYVQQSGDDLFLVGTTYGTVTRLELRFRDGTKLIARPVGRQVVIALPADRLSSKRHAATLVALNRAGFVQQKQEVAFRLGAG
jgi:hypothetical protein